MKGKYKCYGLFLALSIMFGLSLNACSDTNALKYPIDSVSLLPYTGIGFTRNNNDYYYYYNDSSLSVSVVNEPSGFTFPHLWAFTGTYDSVNNTCSIPTWSNSSYYSDGVYSTSYSGGITNYYSYYPATMFDSTILDSTVSPIDWSVPLVINSGDFLDNQHNQSSLCSIKNYAYNDSSSSDFGNFRYVPRWDFSSLINITLVNNRWNYEDSKPYTYAYDGVFINGTKYEDGILSKKYGITTTELFKVNSASSLRRMNLSLPLFNSSNTSLSDGSSESETVYNFQIIGTIEFDNTYTINDYFDVLLDIKNRSGFQTNGDTISIGGKVVKFLRAYNDGFVKTCSYTDYHTDSGSDRNAIDFVCSYNPSTDGGYTDNVIFDYSNFTLSFIHDKNNQHQNDGQAMFVTNGDFKLKDFYIITNNNSREAGWSATSSIEGGEITNAPGNEGSQELYNPDFTSSLTNMFNFSFTNPFSPLFNLFTSGTQCVNIPTIAGMLGSTETQYCSWFDSTTRSVLTPVLGLSSMMLIFGFAVRWLGSSSGNMFEDQTTHKWSNTQFRQKGGK